MIVRISRVDHPPVSGVPVAGAKAGSMVSMSIERYTGEFLPRRKTSELPGKYSGHLLPARLTNAVVDLLDDARGADCVNLPGFYNLESDITIVVVVGQSTQRRTDTRVDVGVVLQETLHRGVVEVCSVVYAGDFARGAAEDLGLPCVEVRVEVDHSDWTIGAVHGTQDGEGD